MFKYCLKTNDIFIFYCEINSEITRTLQLSLQCFHFFIHFECSVDYIAHFTIGWSQDFTKLHCKKYIFLYFFVPILTVSL